jgi:hypothetical protein
MLWGSVLRSTSGLFASGIAIDPFHLCTYFLVQFEFFSLHHLLVGMGQKQGTNERPTNWFFLRQTLKT